MPATFGCAEPTACTQQWVDAERGNDQSTVADLGSVRIGMLPNAVGAPLTVGACADSTDYPTGVRCRVSTDRLEGYVDWWKTTDGRWYGIDAQLSEFTPVGSVVR